MVESKIYVELLSIKKYFESIEANSCHGFVSCFDLCFHTLFSPFSVSCVLPSVFSFVHVCLPLSASVISPLCSPPLS